MFAIEIIPGPWIGDAERGVRGGEEDVGSGGARWLGRSLGSERGTWDEEEVVSVLE